MRRLDTIKRLFNLQDDLKAEQFSRLLSGISDNEILNFSVFAYQNKKEFENTEALIARTAKEFIANINTKLLQERKMRFRTLDELIFFVRENFKGKEITNGSAGNGFLPYVILSIDKEGDLFSRFSMRKATDAENVFYKWLFENQHKIGIIERISEAEYHNSQREQNTPQIEFKEPSLALLNNPKFNAFNQAVKQITQGGEK